MHKLYDLEYLNEISGGDKAFIRDMLDDFLTQTPEVLKEINNQIVTENWSELYKSIHRFIPSFDFVGAAGIMDTLRDMEQRAKLQTNTENMHAMFTEVQQYCTALVQQLKVDFVV